MESPPVSTWGSEVRAVRAAQAGDRAAFDALAARYRGLVVAMAFLRTGDRSDAEDLAQEVLTKAWQRLGELQEPAAFVGWLRVITQNACRDWQRKLARIPPALELGDIADMPASLRWSPPDVALRQEERRRWRQALQALSEGNRLALALHLCGGYSYEEIASLLEVPVSTVEGRIYRAKQQLRRSRREIEE